MLPLPPCIIMIVASSNDENGSRWSQALLGPQQKRRNNPLPPPTTTTTPLLCSKCKLEKCFLLLPAHHTPVLSHALGGPFQSHHPYLKHRTEGCFLHPFANDQKLVQTIFIHRLDHRYGFFFFFLSFISFFSLVTCVL